MKKLFFLLCTCVSLSLSKTADAQWVTIPDANFVTWLTANYPTCMSGNQMDTTCSAIVNETTVDCSWQYITDLTGIQFFDNLDSLNCSNNQLNTLPFLSNSLNYLNCSLNNLTSLPILPNSLVYFDCNYNYITAMPTLPLSLIYLDCSLNQIPSLSSLSITMTHLNCANNLLTSIPTLPNSLTDFRCGINQLTTLPALPNSITYLECTHDLLTSLPILPNSLFFINCSNNQLTTLPNLPSSLNSVICDYNLLPSLPNLPNSLVTLGCNHNQIVALPQLPNSLTFLSCSNNQISSLNLPINLLYLHCGGNPLYSLPPLPNSIIQLYCDSDQLSSLPLLPNSIADLFCDNNHLTTLPSLPTNLYLLSCSNNTLLQCMPSFHIIQHLFFLNTGISCLPNYPQGNLQSLPALAGFPLCTPLSGCPVSWNITGQIHQDTSSTCVNDSLFPAGEIKNVKVQLFHNGTLQQQMYPIAGGLYSFDTYVPDTVQVMIDTTGLPIYVECPNGGVRNEILSILDSLHANQNFGMKCFGADEGVNQIYGRFRPSFTRSIYIHAGDMSNFYGMHCSAGTGGTVKTILSGGQINYVSPEVNALTPNNVSGDTLTYNIADFGAVNFFTDFNIIVHTNNNAVIGAPVCVTVKVNGANDINHNNDSLTFCSVIVSSYDPNEKEVYPDGNLTSNEWLTYTINFQNTGNDTAFGVIVRDTLSQYLDEASFQYLAASHNCVTQLFGNKVVFSFPHINLVDSFTNEPLSHGWVQFKIRLKNNCPSGVNISNRSSIYFDSNAPVLTNSTMNHFCLPNSSNISAAICQGEIYHFGGAQLTVAGNYVQHYINAGGCDSAVNLHLTVDSLTTLIAQNGDSLSATSNGTIQWLDCNTMQIVATGNNFVAPAAGDYAVIATNGSCVDTSACLHVTSVNEITNDELQMTLFPNPATDELNISFSKKGNYTVKITDEIGREVLSATSSIQHPTFNIQHLSSGIYFVEVRGDNYFAVKKFVKE